RTENTEGPQIVSRSLECSRKEVAGTGQPPRSSSGVQVLGQARTNHATDEGRTRWKVKILVRQGIPKPALVRESSQRSNRQCWRPLHARSKRKSAYRTALRRTRPHIGIVCQDRFVAQRHQR